MKKDVLISVVMPVFNGEEYLQESISSILKQTYRDFEFIIVDDGSQDDSISKINSFNDSRIKVISNEKNIGQRKSRNKAHKIAQGKYIVMFDADDIAMPTKLEELLNVMTQNPSIDICFAKMTLIDCYSQKICNVWYPSLETILKFKNWNFIGHSTVMMKKSTFIKSSGGNYIRCNKQLVKYQKELKTLRRINQIVSDG